MDMIWRLISLENIGKFSNSCMKLNLRITPKIHHHVGEFCTLTGRGLGPYSVNKRENRYSTILSTLKGKIQIKDLDHSLYGEQLLKAICMYNSKHCREIFHMIYIVCVSIHKLFLFLFSSPYQ